MAFLIAMHAFILSSVGPWGHDWNHVVWPWNLFMISAMLVLFPGGSGALPDLLPRRLEQSGTWLVVFVWWLLPAASFTGWWESYLSSSLYSGASLKGRLEVREAVFDRLPDSCRRAARPLRPGWHLVSIQDWSVDALRASAYPARRVLTGVGQAVADQAAAGDVTLVIEERPAWRTGERSRTRIALAPRPAGPDAPHGTSTILPGEPGSITSR